MRVNNEKVAAKAHVNIKERKPETLGHHTLSIMKCAQREKDWRRIGWMDGKSIKFFLGGRSVVE
jgi:hypothetical protein